MSAAPVNLEKLGVNITRLESDSRAIRQGDTFVAYPGAMADGRNFIAQAIERGANAVIWDAHDFKWNPDWSVPNLAVSDLRHHAGEIAGQVYGQPSKELWMVGVTGTNGKTSISHWLARSFSALNRKCALLGTLGNGFPGRAGCNSEHHAGCAAGARTAERICATGRQGGSDGSVLACAYAGARQRRAFRCCVADEPDPRPSRLSRRHAELRGREAPAVRLGLAQICRAEPRRCLWRGTG